MDDGVIMYMIEDEVAALGSESRPDRDYFQARPESSQAKYPPFSVHPSMFLPGAGNAGLDLPAIAVICVLYERLSKSRPTRFGGSVLERR